MGVAITELLEGEVIQFKDLHGKVLAIDAYNMLYQFLIVLRGPDGGPLMNSKGQITSHLQGLLSRNIQFLKLGIKPIYVFDGKASPLKKEERERRKNLKAIAEKEYLIAKERNDFELMRKHASRMAVVSDDILESSKKLLTLLGIPYVQAVSDGEAQAAYMVERGDADFVVSEDTDALLFGAPKVIRHLDSSGKNMRLFRLTTILNYLGIDRNQLIALGILVGTDYNVGGIKGIGPKKGIALVKEHGSNLSLLFSSVAWTHTASWKEIFDIFTTSPKNKSYTLNWGVVQRDAIISWLVSDFQFSEERLHASFTKLKTMIEDQKQLGLGSFM
jgi:flap endonuclease-1